MGEYFLDQFSLLHFAAGVVLYFWNIPIFWAIAIHVAFEWWENTTFGIDMINNVRVWPGGKPKADSPLNIAGDNVAFIAGYGAAYGLDYVGAKNGWYTGHLGE